MDTYQKKIQDYLKKIKGVNLYAYRPALVKKMFQQRFDTTQCKNFKTYFDYIQHNRDEIDQLIDTLSVKVSRFFRNEITFDYLGSRIIPALILKKAQSKDRSIRIWSAGCSTGEEPYSMSILLMEIVWKNKFPINFYIFATDMDMVSLKKAENGVYDADSIRDVNYGFVKKYFIEDHDCFRVVPEVKKNVVFAVYNMLDEKSYAPSESIFGDFDLVLCRNVLIYFSTHYQDILFGKFLRALSENGYLILGESERVTTSYQPYFRNMTPSCRIYQKITARSNKKRGS